MSELASRHCQPYPQGASPLAAERSRELLPQLDGWALDPDCAEIQRSYSFKNYYQTIAFVNALAWVVHQEDHHPQLEVGYNRCRVRFSTHSVGGLSENDFICAAKIDALLAASDSG